MSAMRPCSSWSFAKASSAFWPALRLDSKAVSAVACDFAASNVALAAASLASSATLAASAPRIAACCTPSSDCFASFAASSAVLMASRVCGASAATSATALFATCAADAACANDFWDAACEAVALRSASEAFFPAPIACCIAWPTCRPCSALRCSTALTSFSMSSPNTSRSSPAAKASCKAVAESSIAFSTYFCISGIVTPLSWHLKRTHCFEPPHWPRSMVFPHLSSGNLPHCRPKLPFQ
mmetsp:Transcript_98599/g.284472  ORF Transcript_98599/g.284472 Transcript_98599/m.284472 type:complete len:241 (-) Transcript_98599:678-1400(-)